MMSSESVCSLEINALSILIQSIGEISEEIKNLESLRELEKEKQLSLKKNNEIVSEQSQEWEIALETVKNKKIILKKEKNKAIEIKPENPRDLNVLQICDKIKQTYARIKVLNDLKQKGYTNVKEEKLPNGSIRLVVQKWR